MDPSTAKPAQPTSPARSDKSSESEGRPVREKLKETRIDAQGSSDPSPSSDQPMHDAAVNGARGDASTSGSESERGRLRRKRSREDLEDEPEDANRQGKKHERHVRKKSREVTSPVGSHAAISSKNSTGSVAPIAEDNGDVNMPATATATDRQPTPEAGVSEKEASAVISPKNKRKLEQAAAGNDTIAEPSAYSVAAAPKVDERDTKRPRDDAAGNDTTAHPYSVATAPQVDESNANRLGDAADDNDTTAQPYSVATAPQVAEPPKTTQSKSTIPPGSGFSNTSSTSPFATMSPKPPTKPAEASKKDPPQTSSQAFKSSGFGSFASLNASPFAASNGGTASPFGAANSNKQSSFASGPTASTSTLGGFAGLGSATSSFGGGSASTKSVFGGSLGGSAFGNLRGGNSTLSTFGAGGSITGLKEKSAPEFGAAETKAASADEEGEDDGEDDQGGDEGDNDSDRRTSQPLLQASGPPETGEENEDMVWSGRAKLYTLIGEAGNKSWQERGTGNLKFNVTREPPIKARFVLRADGTHRLLLNAAITSNMSVGDATGDEPKDGKLLFTSPTASGEVESHVLKLKSERASELWEVVHATKKALD